LFICLYIYIPWIIREQAPYRYRNSQHRHKYHNTRCTYIRIETWLWEEQIIISKYFDVCAASTTCHNTRIKQIRHRSINLT
jgi:hypothetical protein